MTDLKRFRAMLNSAGIEFTQAEYEKEHEGDFWTTLSVEGGYMGFVSEITFDCSGNLESIKAFE